MRIPLLSTLALGATLAACGTHQTQLVAIPGSGVMPAPDGGAWATDANVRMEAHPNSWTGQPSDLADEVTPVLVTITNDGDQPLRVRYNEFSLRAVSGQSFSALPPFNIRETTTQIVPVRTFRNFAVAPYLSPFYPRLRVYSSPFVFDNVYFDRHYNTFVRVRLPSVDMIQQALPEGVLEPGGVVSGFLYFEEVPENAGRVTLRQTLSTPSGHRFGEIDIPFDVR